MSKVNNDNILQ